MESENIRDETQPDSTLPQEPETEISGPTEAEAKNRPMTPTEELMDTEQLWDIFLVADKEKQTLKAVSGIDKENGKLKTVPAEPQNYGQFLDIGYNTDVWDAISTILRNFYRQMKHPAEMERFEFFKMPFQAFKSSVDVFKALVNDVKANHEEQKQLQKATQEAMRKEQAELKKKYGIDPLQLFNDPELIKSLEKLLEMAKRQTQQQPAPAPQVGQATQGVEAPKYRFAPAMIDQESMKKIGISPEYLQRLGEWENLLKGNRSKKLITLNLNDGNAKVSGEFRVFLAPDPAQNGKVIPHMMGRLQNPDYRTPYFGHIFSLEDQKQLDETGNMGRVVPLRFRNGQVHNCFISRDRETNHLVACRADFIRIQDEYCGYKLTDFDKNELKEGRGVKVSGLISPNTGKEFDATLQVNAMTRMVEYIFEKRDLQLITEIGGRELTPMQLEKFRAGQAILVEDMKRKGDNELFDSYVRIHPVTKSLEYTRYNPDQPEGERDVIIPKVLNHVVLTGEDRAELREGRAIFLENMIGRNHQEFSSFVKIDMETGEPMYSNNSENFERKQQFNIPDVIWGMEVTTKMRADLQDGKVLYLEGLKGFEGEFNSYVRYNEKIGNLEYTSYDPTAKKNQQVDTGSPAQTPVSGQENTNKQEEPKKRTSTRQAKTSGQDNTNKPEKPKKKTSQRNTQPKQGTTRAKGNKASTRQNKPSM